MLLIYYAISNISSTTIVTNTAVHCCLTSKNSSLSGVCTHTLGLSGFSPWTVKLCCQWVLPVRPQPWSVEGTQAGRAGEYLVPGTWYLVPLTLTFPCSSNNMHVFYFYTFNVISQHNLSFKQLGSLAPLRCNFQNFTVTQCSRLLPSWLKAAHISVDTCFSLNLQWIDSHWTHFLDTMKANKKSFCPQCRCTFWRKQTKHHF